MRVAFYTISVSPHQLPLYERVAERCDFRYISINPGWRGRQIETSCKVLSADCDEAKEWLENCEVLILDRRDLGLIERRCKRGLKTFYGNERWFKPVVVVGVSCSGRIRILVPSFRKMAKKFVELTKTYDCFRLLPYGVWAERDFEWLGVPAHKMTTWGYFVSPSVYDGHVEVERCRNVLWVGRKEVKWKRLCDVEKACKMAGVGLDVVSGRPLEEVREEMRKHDVLVMSSTAEEGWGAVVNEALEEGMCVIGTYEAGSSATILPPEMLYHAGDIKTLAFLISHAEVERWRKIERELYGEKWTVAKGCERMMKMLEGKE